jgi:hypothetical protein
LLERMDISKTQLQSWLKQAISEGCAIKSHKPARYQWQAPQQQPKQVSMFPKD